MILKYDDILNNNYCLLVALNELKNRAEYSTLNIYTRWTNLELLELFVKTYKYETAFISKFDNLKFLGNDHDCLWVNEPYRGEDKIPDFQIITTGETVELKCYKASIDNIMFYIDEYKHKFHNSDIVIIYSKTDNAFYELDKADNYNSYNKCTGEPYEELSKEFKQISQNSYINIV